MYWKNRPQNSKDHKCPLCPVTTTSQDDIYSHLNQYHNAFMSPASWHQLQQPQFIQIPVSVPVAPPLGNPPYGFPPYSMSPYYSGQVPPGCIPVPTPGYTFPPSPGNGLAAPGPEAKCGICGHVSLDVAALQLHMQIKHYGKDLPRYYSGHSPGFGSYSPYHLHPFGFSYR